MSTPCRASTVHSAARLPGVSRTVVRMRHRAVPAESPTGVGSSPDAAAGGSGAGAPLPPGSSSGGA